MPQGRPDAPTATYSAGDRPQVLKPPGGAVQPTQEVTVGARGPVPKRSDQRLGHRAKSETEKVTAAPAAPTSAAPEPDPQWDTVARDWFVSLTESGQARFYEPSDWQTARVWAEVLSRQLSAGKLSAVMIQAWAGSASELLTTEGSRRRAQLELQRAGEIDEDEAASVTALDRYRAQVG